MLCNSHLIPIFALHNTKTSFVFLDTNLLTSHFSFVPIHVNFTPKKSFKVGINVFKNIGGENKKGGLINVNTEEDVFDKHQSPCEKEGFTSLKNNSIKNLIYERFTISVYEFRGYYRNPKVFKWEVAFLHI